jgi:hypothetical protein
MMEAKLNEKDIISSVFSACLLEPLCFWKKLSYAPFTSDQGIQIGTATATSGVRASALMGRTMKLCRAVD